jgi:RNA polymerase sigma factor (sigma-70 family)
MTEPPQHEQLPSTDPSHGAASVPAAEAVSEIADDPVVQSQKAYVTLLFNKYRGALHRYLTRLVHSEDAAELVQETYFRLLRQGETVQLEAMARSFLFHTATNLARDLRRRRVARRADQHEQFDEQEVVGEHPGPEMHLAGEQALAVVEHAIAALPQDTRTVFLLHRFRDLSYPQIAQVMNLSARTVARKMAEAIERLSAALGQIL